MPITNKQIDKHKHLGAYGVFFLSTQVLCQTPLSCTCKGGRIRYVKVVIGQPDFGL